MNWFVEHPEVTRYILEHERKNTMAEKIIYRWVEPETTYNDNGKEIRVPAHQEQGEYIGEASIQGYVIVEWQGRKHLVAEHDIVAILS